MSHNLPASESLFGDQQSSKALEQSREYQIMFEYETLVHYLPQGIFVIPDMKNIHLWHGVIFIRSGLYAGCVFKFLIDIPREYPRNAPKLYFLNQVFHPLVDFDSGELNLHVKFPSWRPKKDFIFMLLRYIKAIFMQKDMWGDAFVKNRLALDCISSEQEFREKVKKSAEIKIEGHKTNFWISRAQISGECDASNELLRRFRKIKAEEDVKDFLEWFNNR